MHLSLKSWQTKLSKYGKHWHLEKNALNALILTKEKYLPKRLKNLQRLF